MICVVTGYVPIHGHPRPEGGYHVLGQRLVDMGVPIVRYFDQLEDCWLHKYLDVNQRKPTHSVADNPKKNTLAYHAVQHQKSEWIARAAIKNPEIDVFVWIDYGIFHLPTVTKQIIKEFLARVEGETEVAIPGCWQKDHPYDDRVPNWRFCGGVIVVPRDLAVKFDTGVKVECIDWLSKTNNISWEVNTMARMEKSFYLFPIRQYFADHDHTMFTNYGRPACTSTSLYPADIANTCEVRPGSLTK